jgi:hypothetical protein
MVPIQSDLRFSASLAIFYSSAAVFYLSSIEERCRFCFDLFKFVHIKKLYSLYSVHNIATALVETRIIWHFKMEQ